MEKRLSTLLNSASVTSFFILTLVLFNDALSITLRWPLFVGAVLLGYVLADAASGFVHFLGDSFGSPSTPIVGKLFILPFRIHHTDQQDITRHSFLETNGNNCLVSLPVMLMMHFFIAPYVSQSALLSFLFIAGFSLVLSVFGTNQFHKWAHLTKPPLLIALLQKMRIILNPTHHARHHTAPFNKYFCITTGWLNGLVERLRGNKKTVR